MGLFDFLSKKRQPKPPTEPVVCDSFAPEINLRKSDGQLTWILKSDLPVGTRIFVYVNRHSDFENEQEEASCDGRDKSWTLYEKSHLIQNEGVYPSGQINLHEQDEKALEQFTDEYAYPADKRISDKVLISFSVKDFDNRDLLGDRNRLLTGEMVFSSEFGNALEIQMDMDYPLHPSIRQQAEDYVDYFRDQVAQRALKTKDCIVVKHGPDTDVWDLAKQSLKVNRDNDGGYTMDVIIEARESKFCEDWTVPQYYIEGLPVPFTSLNSLEDTFELSQEYGWKDGEGEPGKGIFRVYDGIHDGVDDNRLKLTREGDLVYLHWQAEDYLNIYATFAVDWR